MSATAATSGPCSAHACCARCPRTLVIVGPEPETVFEQIRLALAADGWSLSSRGLRLCRDCSAKVAEKPS